MGKRIRLVCAAAAVVPLALLAACSSSSTTSSTPSAPASTSSGSTTVSETGSTLLLPLISAWQVAYTSANPKILITTSGTGSGTGIADAAAGTVNIGGSDAYLSSADVGQFPGLENIPLSVAALNVDYNLPGVKKPVNLNGTVLAQIYGGKITAWNAPAIAALNKGVSLPSTKIVTLHRADSSGSTFLFTSYLNAQDPSGWVTANVGTTVSWPSVAGATAETGSGGMVKGCAAIKGCIAYIGVSYNTQVAADGLGIASVANKTGQFVQDTPATIAAALATFSGSTPATGTQSLINGSAGYPIINYEYAIVKTAQPSPATATAVKNFLTWGITSGSSTKFLTPVNFVALPSNVLSISQALIAKIH
ncbi:MAG TPA: phosphate ABC transporter substrate-binding protein PstS [Streptosporangiaceae bacterium]